MRPFELLEDETRDAKWECAEMAKYLMQQGEILKNNRLRTSSVLTLHCKSH